MSDLPTIYIREPIITDDGRAYSLMRDPTPGAVAYVPATCLAAAEAERVALTDQRDYWRNKAKAYGNIVHGCGPDLSAAGHPVDASQADGAVGGIARAVRALVAERDAAVQRAERAEADVKAMQAPVVPMNPGDVLPLPTGNRAPESYMRHIMSGMPKVGRKSMDLHIYDFLRAEVNALRADLARVTKERDDFAKGAFNLADEAEQSKDCGESQGENCCGECIACRDVTLADTASKLAAAREREQALVALLREAREEVDRGWRFRDGMPEGWRPLFVRELLAKIDTALAAAKETT